MRRHIWVHHLNGNHVLHAPKEKVYDELVKLQQYTSDSLETTINKDYILSILDENNFIQFATIHITTKF